MYFHPPGYPNQASSRSDIVPLESNRTVDDGVSKSCGFLDEATFAAWGIVGEDGLVIYEPKVVDIVDDYVGPISDPERTSVFEVG